jgi:predicted phosphodiesterase
MKVFVLSDLHIGDGGPLDKNIWNDDDLIFQIEKVKQGYACDRIICLGDTLELHVFFDTEVMMGRHTKLVNYLLNTPYITVLRGNHDSALTHCPRSLIIDRVLFQHGDQADISSWRIVQVVSTWWNVRVLRFIYRKRPDKLRNLLLRLVGTYADGYTANSNTVYYLKYALRLLKFHDMVVLGHTHQMQNINLYYDGKPRVYLNCGTSSEHLEGFVIDTNTLEYKIIRPDRRKT